MKPQSITQPAAKSPPRKLLLPAAILVVLVLGFLFLRNLTKPSAMPTAFHEVKRGDFLVSIVEGGNLAAVKEVVIRNELEGTSRIIYIVPEGTYVNKGDLLVELDAGSVEDLLNQQLISHEKAQLTLIQAKETLAIEKSLAESAASAAELALKLAQSDLNKFKEGEVLQEIRNAEIEISTIRESLVIAEDRLTWSEKLHQQGFETKSNLDKDRLTVNQQALKLEQAQTNLWLITQFDHPKRLLQYQSGVDEAAKELERVKHQNAAKLAQYVADVATQEKTVQLSQDKLNKITQQLKATKIQAPQSGLVVYAISSSRFSSESMIEEGATVRNRQELIKLPDTSEMKVDIKVHESHINQVQRGQPAFVVLDSLPDKRFTAVVNKVAPLPDSQSRFGNPNLKVYATEILVRDKLPDVKPGVSARVEIVITNLNNVLSVPVQAVTTVGGKRVCFIDRAAGPEAIPVEVGLFNTKFVEITSGLKEGDRVMLSPPLDMMAKDLGGSIIGQGEELPEVAAGDLPQPAPPSARPPAGTQPPAVNDGALMREAFRSGGPGGNAAGSTPPEGAATGAGRRPGGGQGFNREEMLKRFDTNGDGELDENERTAMRNSLGGGGRRQGNENRGNQPE